MRRRSPIRSTASNTSPCWWDRNSRTPSCRTRPSSSSPRPHPCCSCSLCDGGFDRGVSVHILQSLIHRLAQWPQTITTKGGTAMRTLSLAGAMIGSLLMATALTPVGAADMTFERALDVGKEPQNWLLHHGNYQG